MALKQRSLSREEEAELARSNKKVKDFHHTEFKEGSCEGSLPRDSQDVWSRSKSSFKDMLIGEIPGAYAQAFEFPNLMDSDAESDDEVSTAELREGLVAVKLSRETKLRIREPWSKAIIVKLVGRTVGFNFLQNKLNQLWKPTGRLDCVDLGNDFFLARFYSKEDLDVVLKRGPWFVGDHFLSIRPWEPFFTPDSADVSMVAVWIRLNRLPIELYEAGVLKQLGEAIGKVLRIDTHTAIEARGKYARLCVQIDINKPLVNTILIGRFEQAVVYEGIQKLCFSCGRVGHRKEACPYTIRKEEQPEATAEKNHAGQVENSREVREDVFAGGMQAMPNGSGTDETEDQYGPWMVVTRKRPG